MNEIEEILRKQKVAPVSEGLDRRMSGLFSERPASRPGLLLREIRLWQALAACLVMGGLGFWLGGGASDQSPEAFPPEKVTTFYIIESQPPGIRNTFDLRREAEQTFELLAPPTFQLLPDPGQTGASPI